MTTTYCCWCPFPVTISKYVSKRKKNSSLIKLSSENKRYRASPEYSKALHPNLGIGCFTFIFSQFRRHKQGRTSHAEPLSTSDKDIAKACVDIATLVTNPSLILVPIMGFVIQDNAKTVRTLFFYQRS